MGRCLCVACDEYSCDSRWDICPGVNNHWRPLQDSYQFHCPRHCEGLGGYQQVQGWRWLDCFPTNWPVHIVWWWSFWWPRKNCMEQKSLVLHIATNFPSEVYVCVCVYISYVILSVCVHNEDTNSISFGVSFLNLKYL